MSERSFRRSHQRRLRKLGLTATAAVGATGLAAGTAQADTYTVTTTGDGPVAACSGASPAFECATLRDAIAGASLAAGPDTVLFQSTVTGQITLASAQGALRVAPANAGETLTIQGQGAGTLAISGDSDASGGPTAGDVGILEVQSSSGAVTVSGLTLRGGSAPAGGAISSASPSPLTVTGAVLSGNTATGPGGGGAIYTNSGVTVSNSSLTGNTSSGPGGAIAQFATADSYSEIENSTITGNAASGEGGAIDLTGEEKYPGGGGPPFPVYEEFTSALALSGSTLSGNTAGTGGGAISARGKYSPVTLESATITGNDATTGPGGGVAQRSKYGGAEISNSRLTGNTAASGVGGGLAVETKYGEFSLDSTTVSQNEGLSGGGLFASGSNVSGEGGEESFVVDSTISGNTATDDGGGVALRLQTPTDLDISYSTVSGNDAGALGGGVYLYPGAAGDLVLTDSTISGNDAVTGGGVAFGAGIGPQFTGGSASFYNSTIASNAASATGGGIYLSAYAEPGSSPPNPVSATISVTSTIVADNTGAGAAQDLDRADPATSGGADTSFALIEAPGDAAVAQSPTGSTIIGRDPQLGALAANGGPTLTHLPARTSPVVDAGDSPASLEFDQRGLPRRVQDPTVPNLGDGTDIGSVELAAPAPPPPPPNPDTQPPNTVVQKKPKKVTTTRKRNVRVAIRFASTEPGSTFRCKIDKRAYRSCRSPLRFAAAAGLGKGKVHTVLIQATDQAGNTDPTPAKVRFRVVRKAPK